MAEPSGFHEISFRLVRSRSSAPRARAVLRARLGEWRVEQAVAETGELVLSELVTNALRAPRPATGWWAYASSAGSGAGCCGWR